MINYKSIVKHYESCLEKHGDNHLGVDWPKKEDVNIRYQVMLEVIANSEEISLLDFGCGASHLYQYILDNNIKNIKYSGLDLSEKFITLSKIKFPQNIFYCQDILENNTLPEFDYIAMNGVFTEKRELSFDDMFIYFKRLVKEIFTIAKIGIAFNVMSKQVDWEREDLFHLSFDDLAWYLKKEISRNFIIRNDYGLYEYTVYVYKKPIKWQK
jgi:SAM-dependent methyltransferase